MLSRKLAEVPQKIEKARNASLKNSENEAAEVADLGTLAEILGPLTAQLSHA